MNSVVIVFASILGCTVISALTSFALTRYEFKGRKALLNLLIFSMSVPSQLLLILLMYLGRVGGLTLVYAAMSSREPSVAKLPLEKITVG